jgi:hypothetical protein
MEIYTEATSAATRDALKRLGDELSPPAADEKELGSPRPEDERQEAESKQEED